MIPTPNRNTSAILLNYKADNLLIDCGEGTQKQLRIAKVSPTKITKLLITHWHGDHILGIPGLLETLAKLEYNKTLEIYGPKGTKEFIKEISKTFVSQYNPIKLSINEISKNGVFLETKDYELSAQETNHGILGLAYSFKEKDKRRINLTYTKKFGLTKHPLLGKLQLGETITYEGKKITPEKGTKIETGKKVTIILDTKEKKELVNFSQESDILICESTYSKEDAEIAKEKKHLTTIQAAEIAKKSKSKKLILTHFSQRYKNIKELELEAKSLFKNTIAAKDFSTFEF